MAKPEKVAAVAELSEQFRSSNGAVLTEYRGLSVRQLQELRRQTAGTVYYAVVKNTLTKRAAEDAGVEGLDELLVGPSAIAFIKGDPVEAAKGLRDFARTNPRLVIKGGHLEGRPVDVGQINELADLESREALLSKVAGAMTATLSRAASLFQAPLSQVARTSDALRAKRAEAEGATGAEGAAGTEGAAEAEGAADAEGAAAAEGAGQQ